VGPHDDKYFVISKAELGRLQNNVAEGRAGTARDLMTALWVHQIQDAVVIRKQDVFAPPALDAYANAIQCVIEALQEAAADSPEIKKLQKISDYFRMQAEDAYMIKRKLPD
jgi:hypothetical protein